MTLRIPTSGPGPTAGPRPVRPTGHRPPHRAGRAAALALAAALAVAVPSLALAGPGHDHGHGHGHDDAPAAAAGPALPRFAATSDLFELVGVLDGRTLTLFLDEAATNAPVTGATLELEIAGRTVKAQPVAAGAPASAGDFTVTLAEPLPEGLHPVTATVTTPKEADLLAGELDIHGPAVAADHHGSWLAERWAHARTSVLAAAAGLAAVAVGLVAWVRRRRVGPHDGRPA